jgi:hypothetical protein
LTQDEEDRWRKSEPPASGPSAPQSLTFEPLATGIGVFTGIAIPIFVIDYGLSGGPHWPVIIGGIVLALFLGFAAGAWVAGRGGRVWGGPRR